MEIDILGKVQILAKQHERAKEMIETQERKIIAFLIEKNKQLVADTEALRTECRMLREENKKLSHINGLLHAQCYETSQREYIAPEGDGMRPFQTEAFMCIPGDTSPLAYLSPMNLSMDDSLPQIDTLESSTGEDGLAFVEYAESVGSVLKAVRRQVAQGLQERDQMAQKISNLKALNEQLWQEVRVLRTRSSRIASIPRPNTPSGKVKLPPKGLFCNTMSPSSRSITPSLLTCPGDSPETPPTLGSDVF